MVISPLITLYIGVASLCIGSFLNVVIYRLPISLQNSWRAQASEILELPHETLPAFSIATPASHCPACKTNISWWQNIPVLSYILLRARCYHCKTFISPRYPIVEISTCALSLLVAMQADNYLQLMTTLILVWGLIALVLIDFDTYLLPDAITLPLLWLGLLVNAVGGYTDLTSAVWGAALGYLSLWAVYWVFKLLTGKEGMGAGDFKLLACIGAWLGWQVLPAAILISAGIGAILGLTLIGLKLRSAEQAIPFGPFLGLAFMALLLARDWIATLIPILGY